MCACELECKEVGLIVQNSVFLFIVLGQHCAVRPFVQAIVWR